MAEENIRNQTYYYIRQHKNNEKERTNHFFIYKRLKDVKARRNVSSHSMSLSPHPLPLRLLSVPSCNKKDLSIFHPFHRLSTCYDSRQMDIYTLHFIPRQDTFHIWNRKQRTYMRTGARRIQISFRILGDVRFIYHTSF